jgi:TctA family transporter
VFCLAALTPELSRFALSFGSYEFFWLALFGVTISGTIVGDDPLKGWLMGLLGLFVAQIGQDGPYAHDRFTFGSTALSGGVAPIPALIGAFGFSENSHDAHEFHRRGAREHPGLGPPAFSRGGAMLAGGSAFRCDRVDAGHRRGCRRLDVLCRDPCHQP